MLSHSWRRFMGIHQSQNWARIGTLKPCSRRCELADPPRSGHLRRFTTAATEDGFMSRKKPVKYGQIPRLVSTRYFLTVNGTENWVFSHIIFSTPPPDGFGSMAIVNWSTVLSSVSFFRSIRASSFVASFCSL